MLCCVFFVCVSPFVIASMVLCLICVTGEQVHINPRPAGVFSRTRPAGGGADSAPLPNSRPNRRSEAGEAAIESPEREDSNAH